VEVVVTAREKWHEAFRSLGFSDAAADSYSRMAAVSVDSGLDMPDDALHGTTTLEAYIRSHARTSA
jgi:hypothetical protein